MKLQGRIHILTAVLGAAALLRAAPDPIDRLKLESLHRAGQAFEEALARPDAPLSTLMELRQNIEREAEKVEARLAGRQEKYVYDLYSTAAAEYGACLARYQGHQSKERLESEVRPVREYLRMAERAFRGEPAGASPAPPASPSPALPAAAPPVSPRPPSPDPGAGPPSAEPPAVAPPVTPPPPVPPAPAPEPGAPPAPPRRQSAAVRPPRPAAELSPTRVREAADRVRIARTPDAVRGCELIGAITIPGKDGQGVYEIGGRNFFYENSLGLARLKTVESGGDTFLRRAKSRNELSGQAYRCGN